MSRTDERPLNGTTVGIFLAPRGTEEVEFTEPREALTQAGANVHVLGSESGEAETVNDDLNEGDSYAIDRTFSEVDHREYDGLVVPGGTVGADRLRREDDAVSLLRAHVEAGKPAGVICHGPWLAVEAGLADGRTLTSFPTLETDIVNAGGEWVDEELVRDDGLLTSRNPDDLDAFCDGIVEAFAAIPAE